MTTATKAEADLRLYGEPGCSGCLRMKEFVERTGLRFTWVNVDEAVEDRDRLLAAGVKVPVASLDGKHFVNGLDLAGIAELIGVAYEAPAMLAPAELVDRFFLVNAALRRYVVQLTPEQLAFELPGRSRPALQLATHAASVFRVFFPLYYEGLEDLSAYREQPEYIRNGADVANRALETREQVEKWWELDGHLDPLDAVVATHYGHRTMHEVLEREVWHTAQHTRQVMLVLESFDIAPDGPLTARDLAGLPLPERVHD